MPRVVSQTWPVAQSAVDRQSTQVPLELSHCLPVGHWLVFRQATQVGRGRLVSQ